MSPQYKYLAVVAVAALGAWQLFDYGRVVGAAQCSKTQAAQASAAASAVAARASETAAKDERRDNLRQAADDEYTTRMRALETDRDGLRAELERVRQQARGAASRARCAMPEGAPTEPSSQAIEALTDVFEQCAARYAEVAAEADAAVIAGLRCDSEFESEVIGEKE